MKKYGITEKLCMNCIIKETVCANQQKLSVLMPIGFRGCYEIKPSPRKTISHNLEL